LDPSVAGSNPALADGFLRAIKIRSATYFGGELKTAVQCRKILWHAKDFYNMKGMLVVKIHRHFSPIFSCFATGCLLVTAREVWGFDQELLQLTWISNRLIMVAVYGTPCTIPPRK
jgi:hypothetical protein